MNDIIQYPQVKIAGEDYSLAELPGDSSQIVRERADSMVKTSSST